MEFGHTLRYPLICGRASYADKADQCRSRPGAMKPDRGIDARQQLAIGGDGDIVAARRAARETAAVLGFGAAELAMIAAAISEVTRNMIDHAGGGEVVLSVIEEETRSGLRAVARDHGPGITDPAKAMESGLGMAGSRRLMDEFHLDSTPGGGTIVTMTKWLPSEVR